MPLLSVEGLVKNYGRRRVVDGVDFHVENGEIVGLLGPNGAGKTTSFRMTCGMVIPDAGRVLLDDEEITHWPMYKRARDGGMGYLAQEQSVFRKLTVEQNLLAIMELIGMAPKERRRRCEGAGPPSWTTGFCLLGVARGRAGRMGKSKARVNEEGGGGPGRGRVGGGGTNPGEA